MSAENSSTVLKVRFGCDHVEERRRRSPTLDDLALRRASRRLCVVCTSAHAAERERMVAESILSGKEALQVELTGTRKQIDWAVDIRERWLSTIRRDLPSDIHQRIEKARDTVSRQAQIMVLEQALTNVLATRLAVIADVLAHTKAAWWIEGRDGSFSYSIGKATEDALRCEFANLQTG